MLTRLANYLHPWQYPVLLFFILSWLVGVSYLLHHMAYIHKLGRRYVSWRRCAKLAATATRMKNRPPNQADNCRVRDVNPSSRSFFKTPTAT